MVEEKPVKGASSRHRRAPAAQDELVNLNARVPRGLWRRVRLRCLLDDTLLRTFITGALREYLDAPIRRTR